jgi:hypothetical protein
VRRQQKISQIQVGPSATRIDDQQDQSDREHADRHGGVPSH